MIVQTEGFILKSFDYRETSRIATLYTWDYGKISGILKGIRTDPKKFGSNIDKFSLNDFVYYRYTRSDLHLITQADLKNYFFPIRQDYKRSVAANYMLELVDSIMQVEQANTNVYRLMMDYLEALTTVRDIDKLVHLFQIKMLLLSGFSPHLDSCVKCGAKIEGTARFSTASGGLICSACPGYDSGTMLLSKGAIASILHIEQNPWRQCLRLGLTSGVKKDLKYILNNFLVYHLDKKIRSARYLSHQ